MGVLLGLLGIGVFIGGVIFLIINLFRKKEKKKPLTILGVGLALFIIGVATTDAPPRTENTAKKEEVKKEVKTETKKEEPKEVERKEEQKEVEKKEKQKAEEQKPTEIKAEEKKEEASKATAGQKNAIAKAKIYLSMTGFSKKGLAEQLEFEKFSSEDADYAVNNIEVNWSEQAAIKAKEYLKITPFSEEELKEQLLYEGFTEEEASYGVSEAYK